MAEVTAEVTTAWVGDIDDDDAARPRCDDSLRSSSNVDVFGCWPEAAPSTQTPSTH